MTPAATFSVPIADLAEALGTDPEALRPVLDLVSRYSPTRVRRARVELSAEAVDRLGLVRGPGGVWSASRAGVPDHAPGPRGRTVALLSPGLTADRRAAEPWEALTRAEEPPPDRIASLRAWLDRWSSSPAAEPAPPPTPSPPRANPPAPSPARTRPPGRVKRVKPPRAPSSFDLAALRTRIDAAG